MTAGLEYLEEKASLALAAARRLDQWHREYVQADALHNQVVRGTMSKVAALQMLDFLIAENEQSFWVFRQYLTKEPLQDEFEGVEMLYGRNSFSQVMDEASIVEAVQEGRVQDLRAGLRNVEPRLVTKVCDISYFETRLFDKPKPNS